MNICIRRRVIIEPYFLQNLFVCDFSASVITMNGLMIFWFNIKSWFVYECQWLLHREEYYETKFLLPAWHYQCYLKEFLLTMKGSYLFHKWFLTQSIVKSINVTQIENLMHYFLFFDTFDKKWNMKWHIDGIQISKQNDVTIAAFDENWIYFGKIW